MGPKFVIAFSGVEASGVADFLNEIKEKVENMKIQLTEEEIEHLNLDAKLKNKLSKNTKEIAIPKLNFVISSYYKGTGLEEVLKKLEKLKIKVFLLALQELLLTLLLFLINLKKKKVLYM